MSNASSSFAPVAAQTAQPVRLAMQRLWLTGQVLPAGARLVVQHVFRSCEEQPLEIIYSFPMPRDAALRRFHITGDGFEAHSELKETEDAVKIYERGISSGSLAALFRQYGDGVVNLTIGNVRPKEMITVHLELLAGVELRDDGLRFRFPFTLAPAYHSKMRACAVDGEGEMELPASQFGDVILPRFREDASSLHEIGFELSVWHQGDLDEVASPSHSIRVRQGEPARVALAPEKDVPNRDLVLDVRLKETKTRVLAGPAADGNRSFAAIVPSTAFGAGEERPRRTVVLLDRSGSMQGEPIAQARKAIEACLGALAEQDAFLLLAFGDRVEAMGPDLVRATLDHRGAARAFLNRVDARGGTELAIAVKAAAEALAGEGDILIITDGQVFGTEEILSQVRSLGVRLFCLGIGSASQDRFLSLLARETGGISRFVTPRERVDLAAIDLFASMGRPVASGLKAENVQPAPPQSVFAGTPVLLFGEVRNDSKDPAVLDWEGGSLSFDIPPGDALTGETVHLLQGSRLITDWESRYPSTEALAPLEKRKNSRVAARLLELSKRYELASREMSLVAVFKRAGDRPGELPETRVVPVGMPQSTAFGGYFDQLGAALEPVPMLASFLAQAPAPTMQTKRILSCRKMFRLFDRQLDVPQEPATAGFGLVDLAAMLDPDGGMPGDSPEVRAGRTIAAIFAFVAEGHALSTGVFRRHVARLVGFLKSLIVKSEKEASLVEAALNAAATGKAHDGNWLALALDTGTGWQQLEKAQE